MLVLKYFKLGVQVKVVEVSAVGTEPALTSAQAAETNPMEQKEELLQRAQLEQVGRAIIFFSSLY